MRDAVPCERGLGWRGTSGNVSAATKAVGSEQALYLNY